MEIELARAAIHYLDNQPPRDRRRIVEALTRLAADPRDPSLDVAPLQGEPGIFRLRVGKWRALFRVETQRIVVETIRPRGDVYRRQGRTGMSVMLPKPKRESADEVVLARADWEWLSRLLTSEDEAEAAADRRALAEARAENAAWEAALPEGRQATTPLAVAMAELDGRHPLRAWREHRRLTQQALADMAEVGRDMIAHIERGERQGSVDTLERLAAALAVPIEALLRRGR